MSRARSLKPGFFRNEQLADLPFEFRILFQGLWCLADREGRLEDRPRRIKADVFPYDDVDVAAGLDALARAGFILRYSHGESPYIQVLAFAKHQNPHCKEAASTIPAPGCTVQAPCEHSAGTGDSGTSRADSLNPVTDSLNPVTDKGARGAPVRATDAALFDGVNPKVVSDFIRHRRAKRAPITETAVDGIKREAAKAGVTLEEALETCCLRGWVGFKADWMKPSGRDSPKPSAADSFHGKTYTGTPMSQLPAHLRPETCDD